MDDTAKLLILTSHNPSGPQLRLPDELDKSEADELSNCLFGIIEDKFEWIWPNCESHLHNCQLLMNPVACTRDPDEDDDEYRDRLQLSDAAPRRRTEEEAEWIKYAMVVRRTLQFLTAQFDIDGESMRGLYKGHCYHFNPRRVYEYMWTCLNQGLGPQGWEAQPQQPPKHLQDLEIAQWYASQAEKIEKQVRTKWDQGECLAAQISCRSVGDLTYQIFSEQISDNGQWARDAEALTRRV
ncbi:hypothetical protein Q7P37_009824 [Cladosporium fusiforme]